MILIPGLRRSAAWSCSNGRESGRKDSRKEKGGKREVGGGGGEEDGRSYLIGQCSGGGGEGG